MTTTVVAAPVSQFLETTPTLNLERASRGIATRGTHLTATRPLLFPTRYQHERSVKPIETNTKEASSQFWGLGGKAPSPDGMAAASANVTQSASAKGPRKWYETRGSAFRELRDADTSGL